MQLRGEALGLARTFGSLIASSKGDVVTLPLGLEITLETVSLIPVAVALSTAPQGVIVTPSTSTSTSIRLRISILLNYVYRFDVSRGFLFQF